MDPRHGKGRHAEDLACDYLERQGLRVVERNYRCKAGELDLVMQHGDVLVFVEVRYRRSPRFGGAAASVDRRKQAKLITAALHFMQARRIKRPARFDVVGITPGPERDTVEWIPDAFQAPPR